MCGIAGILAVDTSLDQADSIRTMIASLAHRGPDDDSVVTLGPMSLGHRRLSILDTSSAGNQPMRSEDGRHWIVHNGEIYNFLELAEALRTLGHGFKTASDTEVILAAYREWGPSCVERFNGIWAFAIWDTASQELFLSRDRLGVKPIYVAEAAGFLAFASEIKALLALPGVNRTLDLPMVRDYLVTGRTDHVHRTFFKDVAPIPAASNRLVSRASTREWRYWQPGELAVDSSIAPQPGDRRQVDSVREVLVDAVHLQLRSDVPLGSCLSGGLDSSSIVSIAARLKDGVGVPAFGHRERDRYPHQAFFADFPDAAISERRYVDAVVAANDLDLSTTTPGSGDFAASLRDVVWHQDEPFGSASIVAQFHVMKLAKSAGVKVLLDGQGADELFGGYPAYDAPRYSAAVRSTAGPGLLFDGLRRRAPLSLSRLLWAGAAGGRPRPKRNAASRWIGPEAQHAERLPEFDQPLPGTPLAQTLWREIASTSLPSLLRFEDRNSMAFGIEARVPFLDHRLVELALSLPDRLKIGEGQRKVALRRAVADIVPEVVTARRDKIGFAAPEQRWITESNALGRDLVARPRSEAYGLIAPGGVDWALRHAGLAKKVGGPAWRIINLELWLNICVDSSGVP